MLTEQTIDCKYFRNHKLNIIVCNFSSKKKCVSNNIKSRKKEIYFYYKANSYRLLVNNLLRYTGGLFKQFSFPILFSFEFILKSEYFQNEKTDVLFFLCS